MVDLLHSLTSLLFFDIPLLYYIYLNSATLCCLFSGDIYLSFAISVSFSTVTVSEVFCSDFVVILLAILLPDKSPVASVVFGIFLKQF